MPRVVVALLLVVSTGTVSPEARMELVRVVLLSSWSWAVTVAVASVVMLKESPRMRLMVLLGIVVLRDGGVLVGGAAVTMTVRLIGVALAPWESVAL